MRIAATNAPYFFKNNELPTLTFIGGEEELLANEALTALRARAQQQAYNERCRFDVTKDFNWQLLFNECQSPSLFASKKLIEIHSNDKKITAAAEKCLLTLASAAPNNFYRVLFYATQLEKPHLKSWFKKIFDNKKDNKNIAVFSNILSPVEFQEQIKKRLQNKKLKLTKNGNEYLNDCCAGNLIAAQNIINQLAIVFGGDKIIEVDDLMQYLDNFSNHQVFNLSNAIVNGEWKNAYNISVNLAIENKSVATILKSIIANDMNLLLQLKSTHDKEQLLNDARIYGNRKQIFYNAQVKYNISMIQTTLKLCAELDKIDKGIQSGDFWLRLQQYLLLRIKNN